MQNTLNRCNRFNMCFEEHKTYENKIKWTYFVLYCKNIDYIYLFIDLCCQTNSKVLKQAQTLNCHLSVFPHSPIFPCSTPSFASNIESFQCGQMSSIHSFILLSCSLHRYIFKSCNGIPLKSLLYII